MTTVDINLQLQIMSILMGIIGVELPALIAFVGLLCVVPFPPFEFEIDGRHG